MTIDEFVKENNLPKVKILGEMNKFRYYIETGLNSDEEVGIPMIISENKVNHKFEVCDSDQALGLMSYF